MTLKEIFESGGITCAHIIDDAFDTAPSVGIDSGVANRFVSEVDDDGFDRACAAIGLNDASDQQFIEALSDPLHVQRLFAVREQFGTHADILFGEFLQDGTAKKSDLDPLITFLEDLGVKCHRFGIMYPVETVDAPHLVFIDLRLHEDGRPISVDAAVAICTKIKEHHKRCHPFIFLMSTLVDALKQRREEFRQKAKLFASQFEALEKNIFRDENELSFILARYARVLPQLRSLHESIENIGTAVHTAISKVQGELKNLDLADYFVLHRNTISIEKVGLGTYISDLVLEYLAHEVENTSQIWDFARELDKLKIENLPRSRFALTPAAGGIYSGNLIHAKGRLDAEQERQLGPSEGYFYLGDIFISAKEINEQAPKTALVIATPACDLIRPDTLRTRTIFLCEGRVQLMTATSVPAGNDRLPGVILAHPTHAQKQLLITWNKKKLHTWHVEQMDMFKDSATCPWIRVGRLRPLYAIQLQHEITADLSRIGVQRPPNLIVPHGVEILIKKDGIWTLFDNEDVADPTASAFSESEDKSRTVYIFADTTVHRIRRKLLNWIKQNQAKPQSPAIMNQNAQPKLAVAKLAKDEKIDLEAVTPTATPSQNNAEASMEALKQDTVPAAVATLLLKKILLIPDFDQRLMYTDHEVLLESNAELPENCAFPFFGHGDLTGDEGQAVVIIRPGKKNIYESVSGGKLATPKQTATVVLKLIKVKEPKSIPQKSKKDGSKQ